MNPPFLIPDKVYSILKWLCLIILPAVATAILSLAPVLEYDSTKPVAVIAVVATLLGTCLGFSSISYNNSDARFDGVMDVQVTPPDVDNNIVHLDLPDSSVNEITKAGQVTFKVQTLPRE